MKLSDVEVTFKPRTSGSLVSASFARLDPPPDAAPGLVDVPTRPEEASEGRQYFHAIVTHFSLTTSWYTNRRHH